MRVQTEEWRRFIPGVRMYQGKMTLFYNGEKLYDRETIEFLIYDKRERQSWEVVLILPGVEVIPEYTFFGCKNVETVIMNDTVIRIETDAFSCCKSLVFVRLSRSLEFIGAGAFYGCGSLTSMFIPPTCREIDEYAFSNCEKLIILHVPQDTTLGEGVISDTALIKKSLFNSNEVNNLIKNINGDTDEHALHRACSSYNPIEDIILGIVKRQGLKALNKKNEIGITPLQYLQENPFSDISEIALMKRYVLDMMGEVV